MLRATRRVASHAQSSVCHRLRFLLSASELRMRKNRGGKRAAAEEEEKKRVKERDGCGGEGSCVRGKLQPDAGQ